MADDAGALLVRSGLITDEALELARALVQSEGGCLGEHLVAGGALTDDALTEFYRTRLLVPQVNPNTLARLPEQVVAAIPAELAIELRVIPVAVGEGITIAMGDPSSRNAVDEVSSITGTYVVRSVATQMQIAWCLAHYYGHVTSLGQRLVQGGGEASASPSEKSADGAPARAADGAPARAADRSAGPALTPSIPAAAPPRRARGLTSKVNASRHRGLPPVTSRVEILRPDSSLLDDPTPIIEIQADEPELELESMPVDDDEPEVTVEQGEEQAEPAAASADAGGGGDARSAISTLAAGERTDKPLPSSRVRTLTGEIALSSKRKPTVRPDELVDAGSSTIEVSAALMPKRRAANWQDPPELASRTGELQSRNDTLHAHHEEPAVVIAEDLDEEAVAKAKATRLAQLRASVEVQVQEDVSIVTSQPDHGAVEEPLEESDSAPILLQPKRPTLETRAVSPSSSGAIRSGGAPAASGSSGSSGSASAAPAAVSSPVAPPAAAVPESVDSDEASGAVVLLGQPKRLSTQLVAVVPVAPVLPTAAPAAAGKPAAPAAAGKPTGDKPPARQRPERRTQLGLGIDALRGALDPSFSSPSLPIAAAAAPTAAAAPPAAAAPGGRAARDTEVTFLSPELAQAASPHADDDDDGDDTHLTYAAPAGSDDDDDDEYTDDETTSSASRVYVDRDDPDDPDDEDDSDGPTAADSRPADSRPAKRASARAFDYSEVDDGWGPPGSTIPPPWLGAIPGGIDADADAIPGGIPISDESGPLLIAPPSPPQPIGRPSAKLAVANTEDLVAELEIATGRVVELVRRLDQAADRDQIIDLLVNHLAESHQRAGFLTIRQATLTAFRLSPTPLILSTAQLKLDGPSTLQDVVDTQLPYRGPLADESSRQFIGALLDDVPAEILLVPISVRERVVGVLFAERRKRHTFDEQLAVASRAAGVAFERVVRARRDR